MSLPILRSITKELRIMIFMRRNCLGVLVLLILLNWPGTAMGQSSSATLPNNFPVIVTGEAVVNESTRIEIKFKIFFAVDEQRYLPVDSRVAEFLSLPPLVSASPDLNVRVLKTECQPREMVISMGGVDETGTGGEVTCLIEITPARNAQVGQRNLNLTFPAISMVFYRITNRTVNARVDVSLTVWASQQAKQEARRVEQEKQRQQQEVLRIAAEKQRQQEALAAQKRREERIRFLKGLLPYMLILLLIAFLVFLQRKWIWPDVKVSMSPGESSQLQSAIRMLKDEEGTEPGTILNTVWARRWLAGRRRIKVETFASDETFRSGGLKRGKQPSGKRRGYSDKKLDVLVSVGASVRSGIYLAKNPNGAVRITVKR